MALSAGTFTCTNQFVHVTDTGRVGDGAADPPKISEGRHPRTHYLWTIWTLFVEACFLEEFQHILPLLTASLYLSLALLASRLNCRYVAFSFSRSLFVTCSKNSRFNCDPRSRSLFGVVSLQLLVLVLVWSGSGPSLVLVWF